MTQQAADDGATQAILVRKMIAAHSGEASLGDGFLPRGNVAVVLSISVLNAADCGNAHAVEVGARFGRVALKIAVQRAVLLRNRQFVPRLREVVHADVEIAGLKKLEQANAKDLKFFHAFRKVSGEGTLLLLQPRHVRVTEKGYAIRGQSKNLIHGVGKSICRLVGKAVNQIDVDTIEAEIARGEEQVARHFVRLNAVHGLLHIGVEVLNAHAETVEAQLAQRFEMLARGHARVDLDANFTVGVKMEMLFRECEQIRDLFGCQVRWCAAAPMELDDGAILRDAAADAFHLPLQHLKIRRCHTLVFLNDHIARAKKAQAFTEGNMHVERNRCPGTLSLFMHLFEIGWTESVVPDRRGGVACVAWPRTIVLGQKFLADVELTAHLFEAWMCECHAWPPLPHLRSRSCMVKQRSLARLDK